MNIRAILTAMLLAVLMAVTVSVVAADSDAEGTGPELTLTSAEYNSQSETLTVSGTSTESQVWLHITDAEGTLKVSSESITVNNGSYTQDILLKGYVEGRYTVTVYNEENLQKMGESREFWVTENTGVSITADQNSVDLFIGETTSVGFTLSGCTYDQITVISADSTTVSVDTMTSDFHVALTGLNVGSTVVKVTIKDVYAEVHVTVFDRVVPAPVQPREFTFGLQIKADFEIADMGASGYTVTELREGITLKGKGFNAGEALENALNAKQIPCEFISTDDGNNNDLRYWVVQIFGLEAVYLDGYDWWKYWIQEYDGEFTDKTLGYYTDNTGVYTLTYDNQNGVKSIYVKEQPAKVQYEVGESFDSTGMVVMADMYVGDDVPVEGYAVSPYTFTEAGKQDVTITYMGETVSVQVTVVKSEIPEKPPAVVKEFTFGIQMKMDFEIADMGASGYTVTELREGITLKGEGSNAGEALKNVCDVKDIPSKFDLIHIGDNNEPCYWVVQIFGLGDVSLGEGDWKSWVQEHDGEYNKMVLGQYTDNTGVYTLTYDHYNIDRLDNVKSIYVKEQPAKVQYEVGESFNPTGMVVMADMYIVDDVLVEEYTVSPSIFTEAGKQDVTITYMDETTAVQVTVVKPEAPEIPIVEFITVSELPSKIEYVCGETLDIVGMVVKAHMSDGTTKEVTGYEVSPIEFKEVGNIDVMVTYDGKAATFSVVVVVPEISITPDKMELDLFEGDSGTVSFILLGCTYEDVHVESSNSDKVVADGMTSDCKVSIHALDAGSANVRVFCGDKSVDIHVNVSEKLPPVVTETFHIEVSSKGPGVAFGTGFYKSGSTVKLNATADTGAEFVAWMIGGTVVSQDLDYALRVVCDTSLIAVFKPIEFDVTVSYGPGYEIVMQGEFSDTVLYGEDIHFNVKLKPGYENSECRVMCNGVVLEGSGSYSVKNITEDVKITVTGVIRNSYTIWINHGPGGNVTETIDVVHGTDTTVHIEPEEDFAIAYLVVDGKKTDASSDYTFRNVTSDHRIYVEFYYDVFWFTLKSKANGEPVSNMDIFVDGKPYTTNDEGKIKTNGPYGQKTFSILGNDTFAAAKFTADTAPGGSCTFYVQMKPSAYPYLSNINSFEFGCDILNRNLYLVEGKHDKLQVDIVGSWNNHESGTVEFYQAGGAVQSFRLGSTATLDLYSLEPNKPIFVRMSTEGFSTEPEKTGLNLCDNFMDGLGSGTMDIFQDVDSPMKDPNIRKYFNVSNFSISTDPLEFTYSCDRDALTGMIKLSIVLGIDPDNVKALKNGKIDIFEDWDAFKKICDSSRLTNQALKNWGDYLSKPMVHGMAETQIYAMGYAEVNLDQYGRFVDCDGELYVNIASNISRAGQTVVVFVPVCYDFEIGVSLASYFDIYYGHGLLLPDVDIEITFPHVSASGGVGASRILSLSLGFEANLVHVIKLDEYNLSADTSFYLKFCALFYKSKLELSSWKWPLYSTNVLGALIEMEESGDIEFEHMSRDYNDKTTVWDCDSDILQDWVFPQSMPYISRCGDDLVAVFIADDPNKDDSSYTTAMYTYFDGGVWSDPKPVNNQDTAMTDVRLVGSGDDMFVVWNCMDSSSFEYTGIQNLLNGYEVCCAQWDSAKKEFTGAATLTDNDVSDNMPVIVSDGFSRYMVWSENDYAGMTYRIVVSELSSDGIWGAPHYMTEPRPGMLVDLEASLIFGKMVIAAVETVTSPENTMLLIIRDGEVEATGTDADDIVFGSDGMYVINEGTLYSYDLSNGDMVQVTDVRGNGAQLFSYRDTNYITWINGDRVFITVEMGGEFCKPSVLYSSDRTIVSASVELGADGTWHLMTSEQEGVEDLAHTSIRYRSIQLEDRVTISFMTSQKSDFNEATVALYLDVTNTGCTVVDHFEVVSSHGGNTSSKWYDCDLMPGESMEAEYVLDMNGVGPGELAELYLSIDGIRQEGSKKLRSIVPELEIYTTIEKVGGNNVVDVHVHGEHTDGTELVVTLYSDFNSKTVVSKTPMVFGENMKDGYCSFEVDISDIDFGEESSKAFSVEVSALCSGNVLSSAVDHFMVSDDRMFTIGIESIPGYHVRFLTGSECVPSHGDVSFCIDADTGYDIGRILVELDGKLLCPEKVYSIENVTSNHQITLVEKKNLLILKTDADMVFGVYNLDGGETILGIGTPEKEGFAFRGWEPALPDIMPSNDLECTAIWEEGVFSITFETDGGNQIPPIFFKEGEKVVMSEDPIREGYDFVGWSPFVPDIMPDHNVILKAVWKDTTIVEEEFPITFVAIALVVIISVVAIALYRRH